MAGDKETGACVMQMEAGLDTGPVLSRVATPIGPEDTAATLHDRLAEQGAPQMVETLTKLDAGEITPEPQPENGVTYASKIDKGEARIDWSLPSDVVDCHIRGLSPFPGAWCEIDGQRVKVLLSQAETGSGDAGTALDDALLIACGSGAVRLLRLQKAGKGPVGVADFLNGTPVPKGTSLT